MAMCIAGDKDDYLRSRQSLIADRLKQKSGTTLVENNSFSEMKRKSDVENQT